ncbi:MAG: beta galactosidase jelly roll domain-containing protein [Cyclobacteriaceae bacterium]|nr:beta galactosidase jelly roll domain-containing protein [Cyclobacteriaceae bacterium]
MRLFKILSLIPLCFIFIDVHADITLPHVFSSNMVLQRGMEIPVWGWADPGERVTVSLDDRKESVRTGRDGIWRVKLDPMEAGGPHEMLIRGKNEIRFNNILLGDVWICSGQSNMEWPVSRSNDAETEISQADYPEIRLFTVPNKISSKPLPDTDEAAWQLCTPENVPPFSAVGYFFGKELYSELNVPIGLINTTWGGTVAESWTSGETIANDPDLNERLAVLENLNIPEANEKLEKEFAGWQEQLRAMDAGYSDGKFRWADPDADRQGWKTMSLPSLWEDQGLRDVDGVVWFARNFDLPAETAKQGIEINLGPIDDSDMVWINGVLVGQIFNHYNWNRKYSVDPEILKEGTNLVVVRVEDYRGGGGIYGEKNQLYVKSGNFLKSMAGEWHYKIGTDKIPSDPPQTAFGPNSFPTLLYNAMIHPLIPFGIKGAIWYQGESNASRAYQYRRIFSQLIEDWRGQWGQGDFPFLFVQLANFMEPKAAPSASEWAELREAQTMTLSLTNTGMASAIDIGEADDIHPRNKQEVARRLALSALKVAYDQDVVSAGPMYKSMRVEGDKVYIDFEFTGSGLKVRDPYGYLKGFTIAGADREFYWARAELVDENTVVVYSDEVKQPVAVRYGWADNPHDLNLYNAEELPANPFRTDDWPGVTAGKK